MRTNKLDGREWIRVEHEAFWQIKIEKTHVARHDFATSLRIEQNAISIEVDDAVCAILDVFNRLNGRYAIMLYKILCESQFTRREKGLAY